MTQYQSVSTRFGTLFVHYCPALTEGPEWAKQDRLFVDLGAKTSILQFRGQSIPFHVHLFRKADGSFRVSERDREKFASELLDEIEQVINAARASIRTQ